MPKLRIVLSLTLATALAACAHTGGLTTSTPEAKTVLKVENQGFPDMNIYVVPEASNRMRLGTVTGNSNAYFTLPATVVRGVRELRFQALPIATPRGPISQSIVVTPGDTVVLTIPPGL